MGGPEGSDKYAFCISCTNAGALAAAAAANEAAVLTNEAGSIVLFSAARKLFPATSLNDLILLFSQRTLLMPRNPSLSPRAIRSVSQRRTGWTAWQSSHFV